MSKIKEDVFRTNYWSDKKVLVTGASGFKGSWLCEILLRLGAEVYGSTRKVHNPFSSFNLLQLENRISQVDVDISDRQQVYDVINSIAPDVIFHLAAKAQVPVSLRDPRRTFEVNIMGTLNILEACRELGLGKKISILIVSTDHVFGATEDGQLPEGGYNESSRVSYGGPYDTSKSAMELCVRSYHSTYRDELPNIGITRAANVFGLGDVAFRRVIPVFIKSAIEKGIVPLTCRKNGRQFIHVEDIIEGYIRAASILKQENLKKDKSPFTPTFHFAIQDYAKGENFIRIEELANIVGQHFNATVKELDGCVDFAPQENPVQALNCDLTFKKLDWKPKISLPDGIANLKTWYTTQNELRSEDEVRKFLQITIQNEARKVANAMVNNFH